ncbi:hypothetical protein BDQ17DRAFT_946800 [Cyathus striatus]|nr:hypothetical protein BDQ17DRAFT_946800 [Cyathus striatus]
MAIVEKQPQPSPTMSIPLTFPDGNTNVKKLPIGEDRKRGWSVSLCGCLKAPGACFLGIFCPSLLRKRNQRRLDHLNKKKTPHPKRHDVCVHYNDQCTCSGCFCDCFEASFDLSGILPIQIPITLSSFKQGATRRNIRERYQIRGAAAETTRLPYAVRFVISSKVNERSSWRKIFLNKMDRSSDSPPIEYCYRF